MNYGLGNDDEFDYMYLGTEQTSWESYAMSMLEKTSRWSANVFSVQNNMHIKDKEASTVHGEGLHSCAETLPTFANN